MPTPSCRTGLKFALAALAMVVASSASLLAQEPSLAALDTPPIGPAAAPVAVTPAPFTITTTPREAGSHRFWDTKNSALFAGVAALSAADFCVTRANLANGGRELNPITRIMSGSTAGLAVNFSVQTAGVIGLSYVFHKTGHHKLERFTSLVNIGSSASAVGYGLAHR
jgi:hypothetical protein